MTDISQTRATVGAYPKYTCLYDRSKGIKIRAKKVPRGNRMGIKGNGFVGGIDLVITGKGDVVFKTGQNGSQERQNAQEVWNHVFMGKPLPTPSERREARMAEAKIAREEKAAREAEIKRLARVD